MTEAVTFRDAAAFLAVMRVRDILLTAVALAVAIPGSASAAGVERFSFDNTQTDGTHTIVQGGNWEVADLDDGTVDISARCAANAGTLAAAVGIAECYLLGADGTRLDVGSFGSNPGGSTVSPAVFLDARKQRYRLCVRSNAFYINESVFFGTTLACSP